MSLLPARARTSSALVLVIGVMVTACGHAPGTPRAGEPPAAATVTVPAPAETPSAPPSGSASAPFDPPMPAAEQPARLCVGRGFGCTVGATGEVMCFRIFAHESSDSSKHRRVVLPRPANEVACGMDHACALVAGEAWCWGYEAIMSSDLPVKTLDVGPPRRIPGLPPLARVAAGQYRSFAVAVTGTLWTWGSKLGLLPPTQFSKVADGVELSISRSAHGGCVTHRDRTVSCWGPGGCLSAEPSRLPGVRDVVSVLEGAGHVLQRDGRVSSLTCPQELWGTNALAITRDVLTGVSKLGRGEAPCARDPAGTWWCRATHVPNEGRTRDGGWRSVDLYEGADDLAWDGRNHCALWADGRVACMRPDAGSWKQD